MVRPMNKKSSPPRKTLNFLVGFMDSEERENFEEYVVSIYREHFMTKGRRAAQLWFWSQFARSLPGLVEKSIEGGVFMLKNYLKTAIRNIRRQKAYSMINIAGLSVGLVCCMLILLWVHDEWSSDRFHSHADQIYRVVIVDPNVGIDKKIAVRASPQNLDRGQRCIGPDLSMRRVWYNASWYEETRSGIQS
jgi:hypothetical protein